MIYKKQLPVLIVFCCLFCVLQSCKNDPLANIQGVYEIDREFLDSISNEIDQKSDNSLVKNLLDRVVENAVLEVRINGDSIEGLKFLAGETTILKSKLIFQRDSFILDGPINGYFKQDKDGFYLKTNDDRPLRLLKSSRLVLSKETLDLINQKEKDKAAFEAFEKDLGKWLTGSIVDEFGDSTGQVYKYVFIEGSHETDYSPYSPVYVKVSQSEYGITFQVYNKSLSIKETFPESEFGSLKIKYPDGKVKSQEVFFTGNVILESKSLGYGLVQEFIDDGQGEIKILIDVSTASEYYSDKYQFTLTRNGLN